MLAPAIYEDNSFSYTTSGLTPTNCTINAGGYCKIGNLVIVNMRITALADSNVQITGFPSMNEKVSAGVIDYISTIGGTAALAETVMGGNGTAYVYKVGSSTLTNQMVRFSFVYICDS